MRQLFQNLQNGRLLIEELPTPTVRSGHILIEAECSIISAGTERSLVGFGRGGFFRKAKAQPEKVRQVLQKVRTDGVLATLGAVKAKLSVPMQLGYSQAGRVLAVGEGVEGIRVGDRVASNGPHAEMVLVPKHLAARVPKGVSAEDACFTVVGAISLHGVRLLEPTLGETHLVMGLGLLGQLAVQILAAAGCRVLAIDPDPAKVYLAEQFGAIGIRGGDPVRSILELTEGVGVDGVLITASTPSREPILQSADACRHRGRIVLVGVIGLEIPRDPFFKKEIRFQVSCSYGPGRYDARYESQGNDYPLGYVRWTEQRNLEAFLALLAQGKVRTEPLRNLSFPIERAQEAYDALMQRRDLMGILLTYPGRVPLNRTIEIQPASSLSLSPDVPGICFIGSGSYATSVLMPLLDGCPPHRRRHIVNNGGTSAALAAKRFGFECAGNDISPVLADPSVHAVVIATRHDSHAELVCRALEAGKHVFVEKPLATTLPQLEAIETAVAKHPDRVLMVGFNRRYAPMAQSVSDALKERRAPLLATAFINAGDIPGDHWAHDAREGAGRIIGEGCHFVDLLCHWTGSPLIDLRIQRAIHPNAGELEDVAVLFLSFEDGSLGTVHYFSNGHRGFSKERYSLAWEGRQAELLNWRQLNYYGMTKKTQRAWLRQDKGQAACLKNFFEAIIGKVSPPDPHAAIEVTHKLNCAVLKQYCEFPC